MAGGVAVGTGVAKAASLLLSSIIVADTRFAASRAFAAGAARIAWIDGDVTVVYNELDLLWRREKVTVSGLTAYGAFFCLERLAMDRGLRVAFKREHRGAPVLISWAIASKPGAAA
ncbi:MAG: hypothetical protein WDN08_14530 [Rhizomicrobium sp.]